MPQYQRLSFNPLAGSNNGSANSPNATNQNDNSSPANPDGPREDAQAEEAQGVATGEQQAYDTQEAAYQAQAEANPYSYSVPVFKNFHNDLATELTSSGWNYDYAFDIQMLIDDKAMGIDRQSLANSPPFVKYDAEYNFYIKGFEGAIAAESVPETLLPNIYVFGSEVSNENKDGHIGGNLSNRPPTPYAKQLTLNGNPNLEKVFVDIKDKTGQKIGEKDSGQYFDKYVKAITSPPLTLSDPALSMINRQYKNMIFSLDGIKLLKDYNSRKHLFPMYIEISFETDQFTEMAQIISEAKLGGDLIKYVISSPDDDGASGKSAATKEHVAQTGMVMDQAQPQNENVCTYEKELDTWDAKFWLDSTKGKIDNRVIDNDESVFMGGSNLEADVADDPMQRLYKSLMSTMLYSKLAQITKNQMRTYESILKGNKCPSETVFYEIRKFGGNTTNDDAHLQSFYFVNSNEIDVINFVDTQVKYDKQYTYVVYAYQMVLGNQYKYFRGDVANTTAKYYINNRASFRIFKVPLSKFTGRVLDRPPVFPDVELIPYRAVNNKIKISMNSNVGYYKLKPVPIKNSDDDLIEMIRQAQQKPEGEPLEYKTDDKTTMFEIYRMETPPASYRDFADNQIATVQTQFRKEQNTFLPSINYIDNIQPNTVYYYTFRLKDIHDNFSNPSPIYKLKMVDNLGTIYPLIEVVELIPPGLETRVPSKPLKKYVQIIPSLPQTLLNEEELFPDNSPRESAIITGATNNILGVMNDSVWDQKYKIRFTSKKTGRKIDLNIEFKNKEDIDEETSS